MVSATELERFLPSDTASPSAATAKSAHTPSAPRAATNTAPLVRDYLPVHSHTLEELQAVLAQHRGNQSRAAQTLGLTVRQFAYRLRKGEPGK